MYILSNHYILQESWRNIIFHPLQHWFTFPAKIVFFWQNYQRVTDFYPGVLIQLMSHIPAGLYRPTGCTLCSVKPERLQKKWVEGFPRCTLTTTNTPDISLKIWSEWLVNGALTHVYQNYRVSHLTGVPKIWDTKGQTFLRRPLLWCMLLWH